MAREIGHTDDCTCSECMKEEGWPYPTDEEIEAYLEEEWENQ